MQACERCFSFQAARQHVDILDLRLCTFGLVTGCLLWLSSLKAVVWYWFNKENTQVMEMKHAVPHLHCKQMPMSCLGALLVEGDGNLCQNLVDNCHCDDPSDTD